MFPCRLNPRRLNRANTCAEDGERNHPVWISDGAAALILGSVIGWNIYSEHTRIDAEERARLLTQANVLEQNLGRQLLATNLALDSTRNDLPLLKKHEDGKTPVNRRLQAMSDARLGVRTVLLLDAEGTALAS